ncbi:DUF4913 domain-containing protein [Hoyosella sp. YIM 151337]|uniref:DUF4913 domain-containing protein n=1 Tax=Hoyosella sp. YIM 151337 TaxID=2992742 RepID=UPI0022368074|nr:DUF4913 domain-containing protein [Hoyosella sp. YIM 151337]MCW4353417.1 DUF4913 domain-containing protein [Hoyosella sp. YIM 151337]
MSEPPEFLFSTLEEWVSEWLARVIQRRLTQRPGHGLAWDPQWWRHDEVVARLHALWHAWEHARTSDDPSAMSWWWIQHCDPHLRVILDATHGPFSQISGTTGTVLPPLTCYPAPPGHFDPSADTD